MTLTAHVQNAVRCTFLIRHITQSSFYPASTVSCSSGAAKLLIEEPSNRYHRPTRITFGVRAISSDGKSVVKTASVIQARSTGGKAPPLPVPLVVGLDACNPGPHCLYGPIFNKYADYGNVAPTALGDCTFAAVADWEQIVLGLHPDPNVIGDEFGQAGGTAAGGLTVGGLVAYWQHDEINNVGLAGLHAIPTDQAHVESGVRTYAALLVSFEFASGDGFGPYTTPAGGHMAVVDGFTPKGPLVVSWGRTLQVTWQQWNAEVESVFAVSDSPTSPAGPGLTLTPPGPSATYQVKECWTQYTGNSGSNVSSSDSTTSFSGSDILARGPQNFWTIIELDSDPTATISGTKVSLIEPNGQTFSTETLVDWGTTFNEWSVNLNWTFGSGGLFFQDPSLTGQGTWTIEWQFPDGQTCLSSFAVT